MSSETTSNVKSTRIDYLSRLPPELLQDIFDYAYSSSTPPRVPISKHLLPLHQKQLYRQVYLSSSSRVKKFLTSVSSDKDKGKMVKAIEFDRSNEGAVESIEVLEELFPLLPNLQHLGLLLVNLEVNSRSIKLFTTLTTVTSVSTEATPSTDGIFESDYFSLLSALPSLDTLRVLNWPILHNEVFDEEVNFELKGVKTLTVEGNGAEDESVLEIVALCPALLHLELVTTYYDETTFANCLPALPSTLESLKLAATHSSYYFHPVDDHLLRFTNLRSLVLGDGIYSNKIHKTLQQLPLLEKVRLGGGSIFPVDFLNLFTGSKRLVHLTSATFDFHVGEEGIRVSNTSQLPDGPEMVGWRKSRASTKEAETRNRDEHPLQAGQLKRMIQVANEEGIRIEGTIHDALRNLEDYHIEANNRAVLSAYRDSQTNFHRLYDVRYDALGSGLDLPLLDLRDLELVKTELPERDWFVYGLR